MRRERKRRPWRDRWRFDARPSNAAGRRRPGKVQSGEARELRNLRSTERSGIVMEIPALRDSLAGLLLDGAS
jgi:hypothetical protein